MFHYSSKCGDSRFRAHREDLVQLHSFMRFLAKTHRKKTGMKDIALLCAASLREDSCFGAPAPRIRWMKLIT
jgi:hypothetical protein